MTSELEFDPLNLTSLELDPESILPPFIAIEGPIGVGKTSLAKKLAATFNCDTLLERADENPFLERFYKNQRIFALATQLSFLTLRQRQLEELRQGDMFRQTCIADFLIDKDPIFAQITLDEDEFRLYQLVHQHIEIKSPIPDLVIYLQAPPEVLLQRIAKRGIKTEQKIDKNYLKELSESYIHYFHHYNQSPLLIVNACDINLIDNMSHYKQLIEEVLKKIPGKRYFSLQDID